VELEHPVTVPSLLRPRSSDEYAPVPWDARLSRAAALTADRRDAHALAGDDRRTTATVLRALDEVAGGGFYPLVEDAERDLAVADEAFASTGPVVDVQTHLIDPTRWHGDGAAALTGYLQMVDADRWGDAVDPHLLDAAVWATNVFASSETAIALLTSTPGDADHNVLLNPQIAAARELVDRYAGAGRVKTHTIVHPNVGPAELDRMTDLDDALHPSGWKCYPLYGPPTAASPTGGWFLDDDEVGFPFLERVRASSAPVVAVHKGIGGPIPAASVAAASPRDIGPAAAAFPDVTFLVYHSGYERDPDGEEGAYDADAPTGVGRLVRSLETAGVGADANVYAELGSTWYLMLRRPVEAAHVLGKLLRAVGPNRIVWGTDSIWYGSPQPLIDAFRAFEIPERMQEEFEYPALTVETKARILGVNARSVYGITDDDVARAAADRTRDWVTELQPTIADAITRAGRP
jgi:predicted TIM-barrel fold metal-dependent hydrolase